MRTLRIRSLALAALAVVAGACGGSRAPDTEPAPKPYADADSGATDRSAIPVEVDNRNYSDMDIYLVNGGVRVLVGSAPALTRTTLSLPPGTSRVGWRVRLLADPIGSSAIIRTPELIVPPGQRVYWTIGPDAASSYASAG